MRTPVNTFTGQHNFLKLLKCFKVMREGVLMIGGVLLDEVFNVGESACPEIIVCHQFDQLSGVYEGDL